MLISGNVKGSFSLFLCISARGMNIYVLCSLFANFTDFQYLPLSLCLSAVPERSIPLSFSFFTLIPSAPIYLSFSLPLSLSLSPLLSYLNDRLYQLSCPLSSGGSFRRTLFQLRPLSGVAIPARQAIGWTRETERGGPTRLLAQLAGRWGQII
jgi:hypothetical protein